MLVWNCAGSLLTVPMNLCYSFKNLWRVCWDAFTTCFIAPLVFCFCFLNIVKAPILYSISNHFSSEVFIGGIISPPTPSNSVTLAQGWVISVNTFHGNSVCFGLRYIWGDSEFSLAGRIGFALWQISFKARKTEPVTVVRK